MRSNMKKLAVKILLLSFALLGLSGCIVTSVVGLAVDTVTTAGSIAVKTTGAVVNAVIPDGDDDEKKEEKKED